MLANPVAKFERRTPSQHVTQLRVPSGRRTVCIVSAAHAHAIETNGGAYRCAGKGHPHHTRKKVTELVARGEMHFCDRFHNAATYTTRAVGTWQKTRSGMVCTMQLKVGAPGRYVPASHRASGTPE